MKEVFLALLVFVLVCVGGWYGYRYSEDRKTATDSRPSIANFAPGELPENPVSVAESASKGAENEGKNAPETPVKPDDPATIVVKVLNGGAAGGSAGKMTAYLKKNGYAKAEAGNANGSNVGVVVYFAPEMADEVKALQLLLLKEYKGVTSKPASDAKIPEVKSAPMAIVLGA